MDKNKKKGKGKKTKFYIFGAILLVIIFLIVFYLVFFDVEKCENEDCFSEALVKCSKVKWINDADEATWLYTIKGKSSGKCLVNVMVLQAKTGKQEINKIEKKKWIAIFLLELLLVLKHSLNLVTEY